MQFFYNFLNKYATKRNISIGLFLIVVFNILLLSKFSEIVTTKNETIKSILDLEFSYTTNEAYLIFENLGKHGRNYYKLSELLIDIPYAITYGFTYAFIIILLLKTNNLQKNYYLSLTPFLITWFDILENTGIIIMLSKYPLILNEVCIITSTFTSLKWIFAMVTFSIFVINIVKLNILNQP